MRKIAANLLVILALLVLSSCATWKKDTVTGYEITGIALRNVQQAAKKMCDAGKIGADDCAKLRNVYGQARAAYQTAGNALIVAINTEDAVKQKEGFAAYQTAFAEVSRLLPELLDLAGKLGIKVGGE
ncbi:MAG: hypothetical protein IT388_11940 [Nitrospirales bacterium]|nr:hypothetical protein [Nitrospirales bacterium]